MEQIELKPCPFCGSENLDIETDMVNPDEIYGAQVTCMTCDSKGPFLCWYDDIEEAKDVAVKAWNNRASDWISVDDALPEALTSVLVNISNDRVKNDVSEAYHRQNGAFVPQYELGKNGLKAVDCEGVTHWMPLPQPPEVKNG